jgi:hypothetical protein
LTERGDDDDDVDDWTPQHITEGESEATDAPLLDNDDDNEDDNREDDGIDVRDDVDDQVILDMPVVFAAGTGADSLAVKNGRGGTHVHDKRSTKEEFLSRQQWGNVISNIFPLDPGQGAGIESQ